jgi:hypothetical protein
MFFTRRPPDVEDKSRENRLQKPIAEWVCCRMTLPMQVPSGSTSHQVVIEIGGIPIALQTTSADFVEILNGRYRDYVSAGVTAEFTFRVELVPPDSFNPDDDAEVWLQDGEWRLQRGDFRASWDPAKRQGQINQSANPYSIDSVLRIVHTLMLAPTGGFLLHASSAIRNGKAFLFSGLSEAGKTTIARLAPSDVVLLTDEASYVRKVDGHYVAYGTPFAGEMGEPGKNVSAPIAALYLLKKAQENRIEAVEPAEAVQRLLRNILFFAHDAEMVRQVFESACAFVATVPVFQLSFLPDQRVWELIG